MKSEIIRNSNTIDLPFPKLMTSDKSKIVVLFSSRQTGIVVSSYSSRYPVGSFSNTWCPSDFKDFPVGKSVVISNS